MKIKRIIRSVLFLVIVAVLMVKLCDIFEDTASQMSKRYRTFMQLEENTVDAVMFGTSGIDRYWIAGKGYDEYGMTVYPLSTDSQPVWMMLNMLKEAEKHQNPQLVIVDMRPFLIEYNPEGTEYDTRSRHVTDMMDFFSLNRLDAVRRSVDAMKMINPEKDHDPLSYYLPFIKFHMQWEDDSFSFEQKDLEESKYLGFYMNSKNSIRTMDEWKDTNVTENREELTLLAETYLNELLDYLEGNGYDILFLNTPHYLKQAEMGRLNTLCDRLDERGIDYISYNSIEEFGYEHTEDFYNDGHVNFYGAEKFTEKFAAYLDEKYDLPDHRGEEEVEKDWAGVYDYIKKKISSWEKD